MEIEVETGRDLGVKLLTLSFGFGADELFEDDPSDNMRLDLSVRPVSDSPDLLDFDKPEYFEFFDESFVTL